MANKSCEKCGGPLLEEGGKLVCGICGRLYEPTRYFEAGYGADSDRKYSFFDTVSLEKFRRINDRLVSSVANEGYSGLIAALSNGQYYARCGSDSGYTGQCSVERWHGVEQVKIFDGKGAHFAVGITNQGELQTTMIDVQNVFDHIKKLGISDMRMKQVCAVSFAHEYRTYDSTETAQEFFVGLDVNGRIVIHNPRAVFELDLKESKKLEELLREIRSWQPVKYLAYHRDAYRYGDWHLYAITEDGQPKYLRKNATSEELPWTDIVQFGKVKGDLMGLQKDGTPVSKYHTYTILKDVVQFHDLDLDGKESAILLRNGNVIRWGGKHVKCIAKNVVAIVKQGFVFADGSIHTYTYNGNPQYARVPDIKLFENIETFEEEWACILRRPTAAGAVANGS